MLVLAVGGCGGPTRATRNTTKPPVLVPEARALGPVVLYSNGLHLLPLGCWDPVHKVIASGEDCLARTAPGPWQVHTETGDVTDAGCPDGQ